MSKSRVATSEDDSNRVWGEVSITINLGDYESAKVTLGEARSCDSDDREATRKSILNDCEKAVARKAERVKKLWLDK